MWASIPTNKLVGALWPSDAEGTAYSDPKIGFPPALRAKGFQLVDPGRFENTTLDYSAQITAFKKAKVEILSGVLPPPAFATFWKQAGEQGFKPKITSVAKGLLFPTAVEALGDRGAGLSTEVWWSPSFPFSSGLTGKNSAELCAAYEDETKKQWTQPLGYLHALFEVAVDVLKRTKDVDSPLRFATQSSPPSTTPSSATSNGRVSPTKMSARCHWSEASGFPPLNSRVDSPANPSSTISSSSITNTTRRSASSANSRRFHKHPKTIRGGTAVPLPNPIYIRASLR